MRAQAFQDMYASPAEVAQQDTQIATYGSLRLLHPERRPPRPLPILFGRTYPRIELRGSERIMRSLTRARAMEMSPASTPAPPGPGTPLAPSPGPSPVGPAWQNLGPTNLAGRVSALAVDPTNAAVIYRGTAGGGVWKSTDSGSTWASLTDDLGNLSVGAIAVAPSQPSTVYVGTGEGAIGIDGIDGFGFIRSTDGGGTWSSPVSLNAGKFFALSVHPAHPLELLAATSAGIHKSTDGGTTWTTKFSQFAGTEIARVPGNPSRLLATVWDFASAHPTWNGFIYRSSDAGETWSRLSGAGIAPFDSDTGRLSLAIAPSAPGKIYVLAATASGDSQNCFDDPVDQRGIYRSTDGGTTWSFRSSPVRGACGSFDSILAGQGWYANTLRVSTSNSSVLYAAGLDVWKSTSGGVTWSKASRWDDNPGTPKYVHADVHALVWAGSTLLVGNDGGVERTSNGGSTFASLNTGIVTRQYYSIAATGADPNLVIGGAQDNGTNIRKDATAEYREVIGGDGFGVAAHPTNKNILYGTVYASRVFRSTNGGLTFPEITAPFGASENRPFISPLTMDPTNGSVLYTASNFLWKTTDGGTSWTKTATTDLGDGTRRGYVTNIAVARSNANHILTTAGSGTVKRSTDQGATWQTLPGLPLGFASHAEFDPADPAVFYVSFMTTSPGAGHVFRTTDSGATFSRIDTGLPEFPLHVVRVDPRSIHTLYVGCDLGLYRSTDDGATWGRFGTGLPAVSVWDLAFLPDGKTIRLATHGRGFYEIKLP